MAKKNAGAGGMPAKEARAEAAFSAKAGVEATPQAIETPQDAKMHSEPPTFSQDGAQFEGTIHLVPAESALAGNAANAQAGSGATHTEGDGFTARQPDFRVVQPEYLESEGKTIFKDVGALWKNISKKTGREFYTMKIGKLKLLVFPNQKLTSEQ